jgi:hypothetical protein
MEDHMEYQQMNTSMAITISVMCIPLVMMPAYIALGIAQLIWRMIKGVW